MKKAIIAMAATATIALTACESSTAVMSASQKGLGALSCNEIQNTFAAFERDRYSIDAARQLGAAFNLPFETGMNLGSYYDMVKNAANIALIAQSCAPLPQ